ncbi:DUF397 domain-containing protein [Streptomyces verrucosisporus]|uniref:DUF397 domain-containing protein n=1 Tax=Streptomyces verrucosisporus TaxID=1695161 RepID=UPI0019D01D6C|nr:DUF397 domain-containing protein [Streptomyces verrucosisporus]MBN3930382.1 DUF397 domain-containing protein [Streptomyces verrucosisporus]
MESLVHWQKSSFSGSEGPNCVEVARRGDDVLIRESDEPGLVLAASRADLAAFITGIKAGEFDHFAR